MTGVGQLRYTDTPSPIPRLTNPDAHMSHSLSLSLWERQHGCLRGSRPEHDSGEKTGLPRAQDKMRFCISGRVQGTRPGTAASPRTPTPSPRTQGGLGETALRFKDRKALTGGWGKHSTSTAGPSPTPHFCPGLLSNGARSPRLAYVSLVLSVHVRTLRTDPPGLPSSDRLQLPRPGPKPPKLPRGGAACPPAVWCQPVSLRLRRRVCTVTSHFRWNFVLTALEKESSGKQSWKVRVPPTQCK